jgi:RNA polymerase sigma factor (sigma-70 family)
VATRQLSDVLQHLRRAVLQEDGAGWTDGQLLQAFLEHGDREALAALVRRHGPMVWAVCRRVLAGRQDAEEAFQATFLVLLRKAASIQPREQVVNWLYGVAYQTARKARSVLARRRQREKQVSELPEPAVPARQCRPDLQGILDQALRALPENYRAAILLCDVQRLTRKEAAGRLGVREGTLSGHLTRGRTLLTTRLARRGLTLSAGALGVALGQPAMAGVKTRGPPARGTVPARLPRPGPSCGPV